MQKLRARRVWAAAVWLFPVQMLAQGTVSDYQRAQQFLPGNLRQSVFFADVAPHWIKDTDRFWYRRVDANGVQFVLVDAARNAVAPAFDHARLASALMRASKTQVTATELPFHDFEYVGKGTSIEFEADNVRWTCDLKLYDCKQVA